MRKSAVPVIDREALQCFLGQPVADMDEKKCLLSECCFFREAMCCHRLPRNASAQPQNMRWGWKKQQLAFSHQAWLPISCHFLTTRLAFASSQWVLYNCQMTCLSKHFSCRLVIFLLFFWVTGSRVWSHRALQNVVHSCVGRNLWILDILW